MVALHLACRSLYTGECSSAIVAGCNLILSPTTTVTMTEAGYTSPSGLCKTFDASADGYSRAEAVNAVYIKRLSHAIRDNDPIRAIIRGTATNFDGKTPSMSTPSVDSQERLIRKAYQVAGITDFFRTGFMECHGTGTALGDPLEMEAVARVFKPHGIIIGAVCCREHSP
jgi:acyl transferase domain-containing protein